MVGVRPVQIPPIFVWLRFAQKLADDDVGFYAQNTQFSPATRFVDPSDCRLPRLFIDHPRTPGSISNVPSFSINKPDARSWAIAARHVLKDGSIPDLRPR